MPKESVLIIEDEKDLLKLLQYNLEREGYEVILAEAGEKGFELAQSKRPDLIILDLMLPEMDGLEVCRLLKRTKETMDIPILMLTAKSSEIDQVVGLEMGASDYMTKPFSVKILLARLKNILKHKANMAEKGKKAVLSFGDLLLDKERMSFKAKGKPVNLTKLEFNILSYLMENPEIVISREKLVQAVWGSGSLVSAVAVNMQIKSLRDKLGKYSDYIETVRGSGYRFVERDE